MGTIKAWNFLRGYVIIRVEGLTLERFLNLAASNNIYLWDINRVDYTLLEMKVTIRGFRELKEIVKKVGCRVELVEKKGLPFFIYGLRQRKMLGFGFIIFFILVFYLSSLIWHIEIIGNESVSTQEILESLEKENIKKGIIKYRLDTDYIEYKLLMEYDIFSYTSAEVQGTKLTIEVKERDLPPDLIDEDTPCNIVAIKKGIIEKVIARNGKAVVKKGDVVEKGQTLITGIISDEYSDIQMYVHAEGEVLAKTSYFYQVEEPIEKTIKVETGEVFERRELKVGDRGLQFIRGDIPFDDYVEEVREVRLFNLDIDLPIKILVHEYKELEPKIVKQNVELIKDSNHMKAVEEINKQLPAEAKIISKDVKHYVRDNKVITHVLIEVLEDIGEKRLLN
ncbi:MAG: sporulation protein YqfD [Tissierellia bacterium]|nr:sporulation protein YqfD [Tissierellia bacterium]